MHSTHGLDSITDCAVAICATYYLHLFLDNPPYHEPLLPALGGLTGIEAHLTQDLDKFKEHDVIPLFVFDGQSVVGQPEATTKKMRLANRKTDEAWEQYFASRAEDAVASFGANGGMRMCRALRRVRWTGALTKLLDRGVPHPEPIPSAHEAPERARLPIHRGAVQCLCSG